jgi:hypothetical protein
MSSLATNAITDAAGGNTATINSYTPTESNMAGRNLIINGAMQVAQRGTSFSYNGFGGANFCVDRFWFYNGGGATSGTIEQSTDVPSGEGFAYSLFNNTNADLYSGTNVELTKQGNAAPFVVGNTYTLSFWVKGSSASSGITAYVNWRNFHASGTNSTQAVATYPTFNITTSWERVVIPFTLSVSPVSANNVLDFEYEHPAGAKITGVQLEAGSVATPFEHRQYGQELALCHRYAYRISGDSDRLPGLPFTTYGSGSGIVQVQFPVTMRTSPSLTFSGTARIQAALDSANFTSGVSIATPTPTGTGILVTGTSGMTTGASGHWQFRASGSYLLFSAEL